MIHPTKRRTKLFISYEQIYHLHLFNYLLFIVPFRTFHAASPVSISYGGSPQFQAILQSAENDEGF